MAIIRRSGLIVSSFLLFYQKAVSSFRVITQRSRVVTSTTMQSTEEENGLLVFPDGLHPVFVYGSLLSGLNNHHVMIQHKATFIRPACTADSFYLTGLQSDLYPYLSRVPLVAGQPLSKIKGELYAISTKVLTRLDEFEGEEYMRSVIAIEGADTNESSTTTTTTTDLHTAATTPTSAYCYMLIGPESIANDRPDLSSEADGRYPLVPVMNGCWRTHLEQRKQR